jgi:micrococcal nuclease
MAVVRPTYQYRATLERVIDGDTLVVHLDLGLRMTATVPLRLLGVNSPEMKTDAGKAARAWALDWLGRTAELLVTTEKDPEKYGRWLAIVQRPGGGETLNDALVDAGMAAPYMVR